MINKYTKIVLWIAIGVSLIIWGKGMYEANNRSTIELPMTALSALLICSPYIILLLTLPKTSRTKTIKRIHFGVSLLITIAGIILLFISSFVTAGATAASLGIFFMVIFQWLICIVTIIIEKVISYKQNRRV